MDNNILLKYWNLYKIDKTSCSIIVEYTRNENNINYSFDIIDNEPVSDLIKFTFLLNNVEIFVDHVITFICQLKELTKEYLDIINNNYEMGRGLIYIYNISFIMELVESRTTHENFIYFLRKMLMRELNYLTSYKLCEYVITIFYKNMYNFDDFILNDNPNIILTFILNFIPVIAKHPHRYDILNRCKIFLKDYTDNKNLVRQDIETLDKIYESYQHTNKICELYQQRMNQIKKNEK